MSLNEHMHDRGQRQGSFLTSRAGLILVAFLVVIGFLLFTEHRAHVLGSLIYLLPLFCIFMHLFMHGGHGGHGDAGGDSQTRNERSTP